MIFLTGYSMARKGQMEFERGAVIARNSHEYEDENGTKAIRSD